MKSFRFNVDPRSRKAGRFIGDVRSELLKAVVAEKDAGLTQQALAEKLQVARATLNNQLGGGGDLTLREISDIAWALNCEIAFELKKPAPGPGQNIAPTTSTITSSAATLVGGKHRSSTLPSRPQTRIIAGGSAK